MRQVYGVLGRMPNCKKVSAARGARDIVRWLQPSRRTERNHSSGNTNQQGAFGACLGVTVMWFIFGSGLRLERGFRPRKPCGLLAPRTGEFVLSSAEFDQGFVMG